MKAVRNLLWIGLMIFLGAMQAFAQSHLENKVKAKIQAFFEERFAVSTEDLRISYLRLPDLSHLAVDDYRIECVSQSPLPRLGHQTIWLQLSKGGRTVLKTPVTVKIAIRRSVFLAASNIGFRKLVTEDHIVQQQVWLTDTEIYRSALQHASQIVGKESAHFIPKGSILVARDVQNPTVVKPGDEVEIQVKAGELVVKTRGIARSAGRIGDEVSVKNLMTGKRLKGTVTSPGVVCINHSRAL
ncbi:flagella basal body P-ring formation protein FlgA [Caldithrix abyssi DSM 13497]|uniref:Flagella basal body P-ring formation protein FlgA n=2 Tax=Caldithrix abyssi DSM 13497 TaxID=880073 RepID=H1XQ21_CALAY|nr:flagellar basal body P-ring formation chaperone FlgA [Caldithrix abyssi]EHO42272.1 flagella basal body P-ring formation protein FlgA [Caldithrix abyssi DSM 13497]